MRTPKEIAESFNDRSELAGHTAVVLGGICGAGMSGGARMGVNRGVKGTGSRLSADSIAASRALLSMASLLEGSASSNLSVQSYRSASACAGELAASSASVHCRTTRR